MTDIGHNIVALEDFVQDKNNKYARELAYLDRLYQATKKKPELAKFICMGVMSFSMAVQRHTSAAPKNAPPLKKLAKLCFDLHLLYESDKYSACLDRLVQATKTKPELAKFIGFAVAVHSFATVCDTSASSPEDVSFREFAKLCYDLWDGAPLVH
jgi:hypothetical protein